jgi:hypothetical protein
MFANFKKTFPKSTFLDCFQSSFKFLMFPGTCAIKTLQIHNVQIP